MTFYLYCVFPTMDTTQSAFQKHLIENRIIWLLKTKLKFILSYISYKNVISPGICKSNVSGKSNFIPFIKKLRSNLLRKTHLGVMPEYFNY